jgi:hypothetical protein
MTSRPHAPSAGPGLIIFSAALFVLLFVTGEALLGDILGSFGDPDEVFVEHYASSSDRMGDIIGSILLALMGAVFVWHVDLVRRAFADGREVGGIDWAMLTSAAFAFALLIAAAALATVPLGRETGELFDERHPRLEGAETAVLAHFGYVLVFGVGGIAGAASLLFTSLSLLGTAAPGWLVVVGFVAAVLLPFSAAAFIPFLALPAWVVLSAIGVWVASPKVPSRP